MEHHLWAAIFQFKVKIIQTTIGLGIRHEACASLLFYIVEYIKLKMKIWFTSDTHFGHANIIKYCSRPFGSQSHMDTVLVSNWNSIVGADDIVVHFGDVTLLSKPYKNPNIVNSIKSLNGRKILIAGNHDTKQMISLYRELGWIVVRKSIVVNDTLLVHAPPDELGDFELIVHGHHHGKFKGHSQYKGFIDVGVDAMPGYAPVNAVDIVGAKTAWILGKMLVQ